MWGLGTYHAETQPHTGPVNNIIQSQAEPQKKRTAVRLELAVVHYQLYTSVAHLHEIQHGNIDNLHVTEFYKPKVT